MPNKSLREILHNFAVGYDVSSRENRNSCIDQALKDIADWLESRKKQSSPIDTIENKDYDYIWNACIDELKKECK